MRRGGSVDAYVTDLKRLLTLSGYTIPNDKDPMRLEQFITGFPGEFVCEMRIQCAALSLSIAEVVKRARAMSVASQIDGVGNEMTR